MENKNSLEYWKISENANILAMRSNDSRANIENDQVQNGQLLATVHAEVLVDFPKLEKLVLEGIRFLDFLKIPFQGSAADLGSGVGTGATIISKLPDVEKVFAIEYAEQFVLKLMPIVFGQFKADESKIVRVVGDFDNLQIQDNSLSLIIEIDSFHHSDNLDITLKECYRVLKPGGVIISIDRAWPDSFSRVELDKKLDIEYDESRKALYGIPADQKYRRRDNGEHEYTIKEWLSFYENNGFVANVFSQIHPPLLNTLIFSRIPINRLLIFCASILYRVGFRRHYIYGFGQTRKLFVCLKI